MAAVKVICIGDSITQGVGTTGGNSYPEQLAQLLGSGYTVVNYGVSSTTMLKTGDFPYWNTQQFIDSGNSAPDIVIIMLGTNDSKPQNWSHQPDFVPDYNAMIDRYRNLPSHPRVYINTCPTVYGSGNFGITDPVVTGQITPLVRQIGANKGCAVFDVNSGTKNMAQNFPDNVHPNNAGALAIAQTVFSGMMINSVKFYQNTSYGGTASQALTAGTYTTAQLTAKGVPDNWASSARVPAGWTVTMYANDNLSGTSWTLSSDTPNFPGLSPSANDQMSSCNIQASAGSNGVTFYQDVNYGGTASQVLPIGNYTISQLAAKGVPNDWASSVRVPAGRTVIMYSSDNFTGTSWTRTSDTPNFGSLSPNANDTVSSVKVQ